jgi:hypothetical protein
MKYILTAEQRERYNANRRGQYKEYARARYLRERDQILEQKKVQRTENPELFRERNKRNWAKMTPEQRQRQNSRLKEIRRPYAELTLEEKEKQKIRSTAHYWHNREKVLAQKKAYREANLEAVRERERMWRRSNPEKRAAWIKKAYKKQESTPELKLRHRLRGRIADVLRRKRIIKSASTLSLLSCDLDWLMAWLEVQFKPGMTWDNYGAWHVDHIKPCDRFTLVDPLEQRKCFHWTNLQPLWALENNSKNNRYG